jgi:hypothetical protein
MIFLARLTGIEMNSAISAFSVNSVNQVAGVLGEALSLEFELPFIDLERLDAGLKE